MLLSRGRVKHSAEGLNAVVLRGNIVKYAFGVSIRLSQQSGLWVSTCKGVEDGGGRAVVALVTSHLLFQGCDHIYCLLQDHQLGQRLAITRMHRDHVT